MTHKLYIISLKSPTHKIKELNCEIRVCKKMTWAVDQFGKRHLLGASAFYLRPQAEKAKLARLLKIVDTTSLRNIGYTIRIWEAANEQVSRYYKTKKIA